MNSAAFATKEGIRLGLQGEDLTKYLDHERRLAELEALSEYQGDWSKEEYAEYTTLCEAQSQLTRRTAA